MIRILLYCLWGLCFSFLPIQAFSLEKTLVQLTLEDPISSDAAIVEAHFLGKKIDLRPRNPTGIRAEEFYHVHPGRYQLEWKIREDLSSLPTESTIKKEIIIRKKDVWIDIRVIGKNLTIL